MTEHSGDSGTESRVLEHMAVPTLVVSVLDHSVLTANRSARRLLADFGTQLIGMRLPDMGTLADAAEMRKALDACTDPDDGFKFLGFRFQPPNGPSVGTEVVVTGCGDLPAVGPAAIVQIRNIGGNTTLSSFIRQVSDLAEGNTLMNALRWGPFSNFPVEMLALYSLSRPEEVLQLRGGFGLGPGTEKKYRVLPLNDRHPLGLVALTAEPIWESLRSVSSRFVNTSTMAELAPNYGTGEALYFPIVGRGTVIGAFFVLFAQPVEQTVVRVDQFNALSHLLGHWLVMKHTDDGSPGQIPRNIEFRLNNRDFDILRLIEEGKSNNEIAEKLGYSEATVRADLTRLFKMTNAKGRREVTRLARELGLYDG